MRSWPTASSPRGTAGGRPAPNWSCPATMRSTPMVPTSTWRAASRRQTPSAVRLRTAVIDARLKSWREAASRQARIACASVMVVAIAGVVKVKPPISRATARSGAIALVLCCAADAICGNAFASPQLVEFEAAPRALGSSQRQPRRERGQVPRDVRRDRLRGVLAKPEGDGPFPAIVALHGRSGLPEAVVQSASERAVSRGYVILLVDSFTTRSIDHTCTPDRYAAADIFTRTLDAYGALLFLAHQPFVDAHRVAVAGASQGGMVSLSVAEERSIKLFINPSDLGFR